jgi:aspartate aminotransferase
MDMQVSERISSVSESPIRKLSPLANAAKARGIQVYHLNIGQPDIETPAGVIEAVKNIDMKVLAYGPSEGLPEYRTALPGYYRKFGLDLDPEDILVTTAGSEAIFFTFLSLCDHGDEIIIPEPYYTNFGTMAKIAGITVVPVTTRLEDGFLLPDPAEFEKKITSRTKAILFNSPSNPTGTVYSREMVEALVDIAARRNLFLISDEVYREFIYDGGEYCSILQYPEISDRAVVVDSISKRYSMCGARVGAIICRNRDITHQILKLAQARLCPPTIEQLAAKAALETPDSYNADVLQEYRERRDILVEALQDIPGVSCSRPGGAFYLIARLPVEDAEDFARFLLNDFSYNGTTVMVAPAAGFYITEGLGKDEVRIAYVLKREDLLQAAAVIRAGLKAYKT